MNKSPAWVIFISLVGIVVGNVYSHIPGFSQSIAQVVTLLDLCFESGLCFDIAGMAGAVFYIGSYVALQARKVASNSVAYCAANAAAAGLVLISLFRDFNLASATIQVIWISVSVYGISRYRIRKAKTEFKSAHNAARYKAPKPSMSDRRAGARKLFVDVRPY